MISGHDGNGSPKPPTDSGFTGGKKRKKKEKKSPEGAVAGVKVTSESPEGSETGLRSGSEEESQTVFLKDLDTKPLPQPFKDPKHGKKKKKKKKKKTPDETSELEKDIASRLAHTEHQKKSQRKPESGQEKSTDSTGTPPERKKLLTKAKARGRLQGTVPTQATRTELHAAHLRFKVDLAQLESMNKEARELSDTLDDWVKQYKGLFTKDAMEAPGYREFHQKFRALKKRYTQYTNEHAGETLAMRRLDQKFISDKLDDASLHLHSPILLAITQYFGASFTERAQGAKHKIPVLYKLAASGALNSPTTLPPELEHMAPTTEKEVRELEQKYIEFSVVIETEAIEWAKKYCTNQLKHELPEIVRDGLHHAIKLLDLIRVTRHFKESTPKQELDAALMMAQVIELITDYSVFAGMYNQEFQHSQRTSATAKTKVTLYVQCVANMAEECLKQADIRNMMGILTKHFIPSEDMSRAYLAKHYCRCVMVGASISDIASLERAFSSLQELSYTEAVKSLDPTEANARLMLDLCYDRAVLSLHGAVPAITQMIENEQLSLIERRSYLELLNRMLSSCRQGWIAHAGKSRTTGLSQQAALLEADLEASIEKTRPVIADIEARFNDQAKDVAQSVTKMIRFQEAEIERMREEQQRRMEESFERARKRQPVKTETQSSYAQVTSETSIAVQPEVSLCQQQLLNACRILNSNRQTEGPDLALPLFQAIADDPDETVTEQERAWATTGVVESLTESLIISFTQCREIRQKVAGYQMKIAAGKLPSPEEGRQFRRDMEHFKQHLDKICQQLVLVEQEFGHLETILKSESLKDDRTLLEHVYQRMERAAHNIHQIKELDIQIEQTFRARGAMLRMRKARKRSEGAPTAKLVQELSLIEEAFQINAGKFHSFIQRSAYNAKVFLAQVHTVEATPPLPLTTMPVSSGEQPTSGGAQKKKPPRVAAKTKVSSSEEESLPPVESDILGKIATQAYQNPDMLAIQMWAFCQKLVENHRRDHDETIICGHLTVGLLRKQCKSLGRLKAGPVRGFELEYIHLLAASMKQGVSVGMSDGQRMTCPGSLQEEPYPGGDWSEELLEYNFYSGNGGGELEWPDLG